MAQSLPSPCSHPTCPEVSHDRYCKEHTSEKWSGDDRPSASERGYGTRWQKVRKRYLATVNYLCEPCNERGETTEAHDVHHIDGDPSHNNSDNLMAVCRPCHRREENR